MHAKHVGEKFLFGVDDTQTSPGVNINKSCGNVVCLSLAVFFGAHITLLRRHMTRENNFRHQIIDYDTAV